MFQVTENSFERIEAVYHVRFVDQNGNLICNDAECKNPVEISVNAAKYVPFLAPMLSGEWKSTCTENILLVTLNTEDPLFSTKALVNLLNQLKEESSNNDETNVGCVFLLTEQELWLADYFGLNIADIVIENMNELVSLIRLSQSQIFDRLWSTNNGIPILWGRICWTWQMMGADMNDEMLKLIPLQFIIDFLKSFPETGHMSRIPFMVDSTVYHGDTTGGDKEDPYYVLDRLLERIVRIHESWWSNNEKKEALIKIFDCLMDLPMFLQYHQSFLLKGSIVQPYLSRTFRQTMQNWQYGSVLSKYYSAPLIRLKSESWPYLDVSKEAKFFLFSNESGIIKKIQCSSGTIKECIILLPRETTYFDLTKCQTIDKQDLNENQIRIQNQFVNELEIGILALRYVP